MSNYDLQSRLNSLENELRQVENINRELKNELSEISQYVRRAQKELDDFNQKIRNNLENCNNTMNRAKTQINDSFELQCEITNLYTQFKEIEFANKKIREYNNKKYYDFNNYATVRKIVQGMMDNLDLTMISDKTITKSIEKQHLQSPDYWLTCVLISIMAWKNDDKELSDRAMLKAMQLDKKSTSIFYMLFNLRMSREEASLKWFYTYQECELKGNDQSTFLMLFSLISKTLNDNVDENTKNEIKSFIDKVVDCNTKSNGYNENDIIIDINRFFNKMNQKDKLNYPLLIKYCNEANLLNSVLNNAKNNVNILDYILKTINVDIEQKNAYLKNFIDELIAKPNQIEKDIYDQITYYDRVIQLNGDTINAKQEVELEKKRQESELNIISDMVNWLYGKSDSFVNNQIKKNIFVITKNVHLKAIDNHVANYRSKFKTILPVKIEDYSTNVNFSEIEIELKKIEQYYIEERNSKLEKIKDLKAYISFGIAPISLVSAFFIGYWMFALTLVSLVFGVYVIISNKNTRQNLNIKYNDKITDICECMNDLFKEFQNYLFELEEYDKYYDVIYSQINML